MRWMVCSLLVGFAGASLLQAQRMERHVVSSGAVEARGAGIVLRGTIGQPIIGLTRGSPITIGQGFWYRGAGVLGTQEPVPAPVRIQPQPAVTEAVVEADCAATAEAEVFTVGGKHVATVAFASHQERKHHARIDCTQLASGLYLVRVRCGTDTHVLPFVVSK
ncbi:MAG: hypothetical protein NZ481_05820 [Candidatus Kapabacteria bacterium]|nr:hypothetical protein [Candidatus Kapabacteria bacterium]